MFISIALATFNGSKYIKEQLESFAAQSVIPDELVICDDGSTDDTAEIIVEFMNTSPFKVNFIQNDQNLGHVQNFAKAMSMCKGEVVFLSDQDDLWFPDKIETVIQVFQQYPDCWVVIHDGELTDGQLVSSGQTKMSQIRRGYGTVEKVSTGALSAIRQDMLKFALPIPSSIIAHDTWLHQLASLLPGRRVILEQTLQYIRRHNNNTSNWIVNSDSKISRLDVIRSQAKSEPAYDYTDRLAINTGLTNAVNHMFVELTDRSSLSALRRVKAQLVSERDAIYHRQSLVEYRSFKRKFCACSMLLSGQYVHFNGIRSFIRDITRRKAYPLGAGCPRCSRSGLRSARCSCNVPACLHAGHQIVPCRAKSSRRSFLMTRLALNISSTSAGPKASAVRLAAAKRLGRWTANDQHGNVQGVDGRPQ